MPFIATFWNQEDPIMVTVEDDVILSKKCIKLTNIEQCKESVKHGRVLN